MQNMIQVGSATVRSTREPNSRRGLARHITACEAELARVRSDGIMPVNVGKLDSRQFWAHIRELGMEPTFRGYATPPSSESLKPWERHRRQVLHKVDYVHRRRREQTDKDGPSYAGPTAAHLLGLPTISRHPQRVLRQTGPAGTPSRSTHVRTLRLAYEPATINLSGIQVASPAQTAIDLARYVGVADGLVAANFVLHKELATREDFLEILETLPRIRGLSNVRRVLSLMDGRVQTPGESLAMLRFVDYGLPPSEPQMQFDFGFQNFYPDFTDLENRVTYEFHGTQKLLDPAMLNNLNYRQSIEHEGLRDLHFRQAGFLPFHLGWDDVRTAASFKHWLARARADGLPV
ncbi:hypothetical protein J2S70_000803 [Trueperella bonasi]|uniref:Uncharacterized protein n=1 Tax=Trueperella bonasi TaxID=312286 RepID=A0ABT9NFR2_9ACTO|nr:hypothetical protein [Trueperella bonasi]MDP9806221.1 hypothetical protein [Trueperella bonasi]